MAGALCGWRLRDKSANAAATSHVPQWSLFGTPWVAGVSSGGCPSLFGAPFSGHLGVLSPSHGADNVNSDHCVYGLMACLCLGRTD